MKQENTELRHSVLSLAPLAQGLCALYLGEASALYLGEASLCGTVTSSSHMTPQPRKLGLETRTIARYLFAPSNPVLN